MRYIEIGENEAISLDGLKRYGNIVCTGKDAELRQVLQQAAIRVQEYADRALLPCTIEIDGEGDRAQLWQPLVSSIVSVTNDGTGEDVLSSCTVYSDRVYLPAEMRYTIRYTTQPLYSDVQRLLSFVWQMAVAIWDGNTEEEAKVYQRIPAGYVVR